MQQHQIQGIVIVMYQVQHQQVSNQDHHLLMEDGLEQMNHVKTKRKKEIESLRKNCEHHLNHLNLF